MRNEEIILCNKCRKPKSAKYKGQHYWRTDWLGNGHQKLCHKCYTEERVGIRKELQKILRPSVFAILFIVIATVPAVNNAYALTDPTEMLTQIYQDINYVLVQHGYQPVFATPESSIVLKSHSFNTDVFPQIIGEVENNSTRTYERFDIDIVANFRDATGILVSSETGYIDANTFAPGDSSAFDVTSLDETLPDKATTYDLIIEDHRIVEGAPLEGGSGNNNEDDNEDEEGSND